MSTCSPDPERVRRRVNLSYGAGRPASRSEDYRERGFDGDLRPDSRSRIRLVVLAAREAPLVAARVATTRLIVLVAAMIPSPGETGAQWWSNTGWETARRSQAERDGRATDGELDPVEEFLHDVDQEIIDETRNHVADQSDAPFQTPWPLEAWPSIPTRFVLPTRDRFFPADFQRGIVRERLGVTPDEIACGHLPALARPVELASLLLDYERTPGATGSSRS